MVDFNSVEEPSRKKNKQKFDNINIYVLSGSNMI